MDDDSAYDLLLASLDGARLTEPMALRFTPGRRRKAWAKNCVALGLACGFLEPLEATSIIHPARHRDAAQVFPDRQFEQADIGATTACWNSNSRACAIPADALCAHERRVRSGALPRHPVTETLQEKIDLFRSRGRILREDTSCFRSRAGSR